MVCRGYEKQNVETSLLFLLSSLDYTAVGGSGPLYCRYYYRKGATGQWTEIKGYSIDNSCTWTPLEEGFYVVVVHVTDDPSGNTFSIAGMTCTIGE